MKVTLTTGRCSLCENPRNEGVLITWFWFVRVFVCETCWAGFFRRFRRDK